MLCTDSKATIVWQDGTEEKDVPTTQLYYSISLDDHEFFPGEWVVQEGKTDKLYGAIQYVNHLERTAAVSIGYCSLFVFFAILFLFYLFIYLFINGTSHFTISILY